MNRCVIVGAAPVAGVDALRPYLRSDDFVMAADGGQRLLQALGIPYDLLIGDFDSSDAPSDAAAVVLPTHKDDTDVLAAMRMALERGYQEFLLLGCLGGRLDHTLANVFLLRFLEEHGAHGMLVDDLQEVTLLGVGTHIVSPRTDRVLSLLPYGGDAEGVTIEGAEYPLDDATLDTVFPLGVSNAFLGEPVRISIKRGRLLLILTKMI